MRYQRKNKYYARKTIIDGIQFDSKAEARRYSELKLLERAGLIKDLKLQHRFTIFPGYVNGEGQRIRSIEYVADFVYFDVKKDIDVIEDVKGKKTPVYLLKKKLFEKFYHPYTITEIG